MATVLCPACGLYVPLYDRPSATPVNPAVRGTLAIHGRVPVPGVYDGPVACFGAGRPVRAVYEAGRAKDFRTGPAGEILLS